MLNKTMKGRKMQSQKMWGTSGAWKWLLSPIPCM